MKRRPFCHDSVGVNKVIGGGAFCSPSKRKKTRYSFTNKIFATVILLYKYKTFQTAKFR